MAAGSLHHGRFLARVHNGHRNPSTIFRSNQPTLAQAWSGDRNNFNLMRLIAAWLVIYGHAWAITAAPGSSSPATSRWTCFS